MKLLVEPRGTDSLVIRLGSPVEMNDKPSVDAFYGHVFDTLEKALKGRKAYLLVDMSKATIGMAAAKHYGECSKKLATTYALGVIRFGVQGGMTRTAVLAQSIINHYSANVYEDLAAAEAVLQRLRDGGTGTGRAARS